MSNQHNGYEKTLTSGAIRTLKAKKNVLSIIFIKSASVLLSFCIMRATFHLLDQELYGAWLTILSVLSWINLFDIGIGHGLRNKLTESLARENKAEGKIFVSTAYSAFGFFIALMAALYLIVSPFINWSSIFKITTPNLAYLLNWLILAYLLFFFFSLIKPVMFACHDASFPGLMALTTNFFIYVGILYINKNYQPANLTNIGLLYAFTTVCVVVLFSMALYLSRYKEIRPSLFWIQFKYLPKVFTLGIKFFIIQMAAAVIFTTDSLIITQYLGPEKVVAYQAVLKLFNVFSTAQVILLTPFWSSYTEAYVQNDYLWIRNTLKKLILFMIPLIAGVCVLGFSAKTILAIWLGKDLHIDNLLILLMGFYVVLTMWSNIFAYFLNGISHINIQMYSAVISGLINIPLSIYFASGLGLGSSGVILGTIISISIGGVVTPVQTYFIIKKMKRNQ